MAAVMPGCAFSAYENTNGNPDDALYIGTDIGVFYRDNTLGDWIPYSNLLPVVPVFDLEINENEDCITAGTYGRGLWRSSTYSGCEWNITYTGTGYIGYIYHQAHNSISRRRIYNHGLGQETHYKAGNFIKLLPGFQVTNGSKFDATLGPCTGGVP